MVINAVVVNNIGTATRIRGDALVQDTIVAEVTEADADTADDVVVIMVKTDETYANAAKAVAVILPKPPQSTRWLTSPSPS